MRRGIMMGAAPGRSPCSRSSTAISLANDDGRALAAAGFAVAYLLRDLSSAKELIDRAVELNPSLVNAQTNGGWISLWLGHPELAVEQLSRAQRLDPVSDSFPTPWRTPTIFWSDMRRRLIRRSISSGAIRTHTLVYVLGLPVPHPRDAPTWHIN
jgi:tetratricopeptide (TPR) repeat protein